MRPFRISSVESQKGIITIQRYSFENKKGDIAVQIQSDSALMVLKGTSLNSDNAPLVVLTICPLGFLNIQQDFQPQIFSHSINF